MSVFPPVSFCPSFKRCARWRVIQKTQKEPEAKILELLRYKRKTSCKKRVILSKGKFPPSHCLVVNEACWVPRNVRALPINVTQLNGIKGNHVHLKLLRRGWWNASAFICKSGSLNLEDPFIKHLFKSQCLARGKRSPTNLWRMNSPVQNLLLIRFTLSAINISLCSHSAPSAA